MKMTFTARGIAALWLRGHAPSAEQDDIDSLATLLEGIWADGVKKGMDHSLDVMGKSPTMSAAQATLEADASDLCRQHQDGETDQLDFDLTEYAKKPLEIETKF